MNDLNQMMSRLSGLDSTKEILNLWFEVNYLRILISHIVELSPDIHEKITHDVFEKCREESKKLLLDKFPNLGITFGDKKGEEE